MRFVIVSGKDFCHSSVSFIQNRNGFIAASWKTSAFGQAAEKETGPRAKLDSLDNIADGEAVIGVGSLSCSSQESIT